MANEVDANSLLLRANRNNRGAGLTALQSEDIFRVEDADGVVIARIGADGLKEGFGDSSGLITQPTSLNNIAKNPHATCRLGNYFYVFDVEIGSGCKININDFNDVTYTTSCPRLAAMCYGGDGYLYGVGMEATVRIYKIDPTTLAFTQIGNTGISSGSRPSICSDLAGSLYFTSITSIQKWSTAGTQLVSVTSSVLSVVDRGHAIEFKNGFVWVTGSGYVLLKLSPTTLTGSSSLADAPFLQTDDFAIDANKVYLVDESNTGLNRMRIVDQTTLTSTYVTIPYPSYAIVYDGVDTLWLSYGTESVPVTGLVGRYIISTGVLTSYRTSAPGTLNELIIIDQYTLMATSWGTVAPFGGYISKFSPARNELTYSTIKTQIVDNGQTVAVELYNATSVLRIGSSTNYEGVINNETVLSADYSLLNNSGIGSSFNFSLTAINADTVAHTITFDPVTFADVNGLATIEPLYVPALGVATISLVFVGLSSATGLKGFIEQSRRSSDNSLSLVRRESPGAGINQVLYVEAQYAGAASETAFGIYGRFINTGSLTPSVGEHLVGVLGRAGDTASGKVTLYGAESRVDGAGTAGLEYGAHFAFANFGGASFGGSLIGNLVRSEIYTDGTYTVPLAQGANIGVKVTALVGGSIKRSWVAFDEMENRAPIGAYSTDGAHSAKLFHDGDSARISASSGTGGHVKLEPTAGGYAIVATGLGLVPLTGGISLGIPSLRWLINGTSCDLTGNLTLVPPASATPTVNSQLTFQATSNTSLTFKLKGTDGTVRSGSIALA